MPAASTIIIAREDFSIPGSSDDLNEGSAPAALEQRFFELLKDNRPDLVVLDLTHTKGGAIDTIRTLRERSGVPILVIHAHEDPRIEDYRVCGAAGCVAAPVEIIKLNEAIQRIIAITRTEKSRTSRQRMAVRFADLTFDPDQNNIVGAGGAKATLTTLENDVLSFLVARPRATCSRAEIAQTLYGSHQPTTDRAIDMIVNRLRKKLDMVDLNNGRNLIKTEFRRGYVLTTDVTPAHLP